MLVHFQLLQAKGIRSHNMDPPETEQTSHKKWTKRGTKNKRWPINSVAENNTTTYWLHEGSQQQHHHHQSASCLDVNSVNKLFLSDPLLWSQSPGLKTHLSGLAFLSEAPHNSLIWFLFYRYKALWELFLSEKSALQMLFIIDMGLILRPAVLWGVCFSPVWVFCCCCRALWTWQVDNEFPLILFYGSVDRTWCRFAGQMCL